MWRRPPDRAHYRGAEIPARRAPSTAHRPCVSPPTLQVCQSTGYFELQLLSVDNPGGQLLNGDCCDAEKSAAEGHCGSDECDTYLRVCLKEYQTEVMTTGPCTYGSETTKVLGGNTFHFKGGQKSGSNRNNEAGKIVIPFQFAWPVSRWISRSINESINQQIYQVVFIVVIQ